MPFLAPIVTAVVGFVGSIGFIGQAILGIGLNLLVGKLTSKKRDQPAVAGTQFERQYGENTSRKVACGRVGIAGHDCYVNTFGSANKYIEQVYAFSDFPCDALVKVWAGGTELPIVLTGDYGSAKTYVVADGAELAGLVSFTFYDGTQTVADTSLVTDSNPTGRWTANHIGTGICYIVVQMNFDQDKLNSPPDFFFELRGARLYDLRKDSSVGGVGSHRWGNYSTYEFTENPVVMEYNYRRGFAVNDDLFLGMGMAESDLPFARYVTAMNICDETVSAAPRYRCSIIFDADNEHGDNIEAVMTACGGIVIDSVEGSWPLIGSDQPIIETFTDDDLIADEPVRFQRRRSMADLVNSVSGTYPEPSNLWSPVGYDEQTNASYVALDRRSRDMSLDLATVPYKAQANQLAAIYFNENRYEATADIVLRPRFQTLKAGDWCRWNSARYGDRVYMIQARSIMALSSDGPRNVSLSLQERDGGIYDSVTVIPPSIPIPPGEPVYLNELQDFAVIPVIGTGADGRSYPAFRLSWSPIVDPTVTGIVFEWWVSTTPDNLFNRSVDVSQTVTFIQEGILSLTMFKFRYKLLADRTTNYVGPFSVMSLDGGNADLEVNLANIGADVRAVFTDLFATMGRTESLLVQMQQNYQITSSVSQSIGRKLSVQGASFNEQITVIESDVASIAAQTTELATEFENSFAGGLVSFQAVSAPGDVNVRFAILLKASIDDDWMESGFFIEIYTDGGVLKSQAAFDVGRFTIMSDDDQVLPFVFDSTAGVFKLQNLKVSTLSALSATLGNVDISNANIGNLVVGTSNIQSGVITRVDSVSNSGTAPTEATVTSAHGTGPCRLEVIFGTVWNQSSGSPGGTLTFYDDTAGTTLFSFGVGTGLTTPASACVSFPFIFTPPAGRASTTFRIRCTGNGSHQQTITVKVIKG
jgi:hypothetical protein